MIATEQLLFDLQRARERLLGAFTITGCEPHRAEVVEQQRLQVQISAGSREQGLGDREVGERGLALAVGQSTHVESQNHGLRGGVIEAALDRTSQRAIEQRVGPRWVMLKQDQVAGLRQQRLREDSRLADRGGLRLRPIARPRRPRR